MLLLNGAALAASPVRIGVLAYLGEHAAREQWSPVVERLRNNVPHRDFELVALDHAGIRTQVEDGALDFVITNPGHYVELEAGFGVSRILTLASGNGGDPARAIGSAVITRADRDDLRQLTDLRGQRVAIVSPDAFGGYQLVWREIAGAGLDPTRDFGELRGLGFPMDKVFEAVRSGEVDAGIVRACLAEALPSLADGLKVVGQRREPDFPCATSTRLYPDWPIATLRHTSAGLAREVAVALLAAPGNTAEPAWAMPADYQPVRELFLELQIGPYADLRTPTLAALAERYWPALAMVLTLLLAWVLYTVRVEHLVHDRTSALRAALVERERLEARMRANQEQADHLARLSMLGELSGTLAHELNQPLATIGNYAQSLTRRAHAGRLTESATVQAATEIATQAERAATILARIRAFARKRVTQREARRPAEVVHEAVALFRGMMAQAPDVIIEDALPEDLTVEVDPLQVQQVLLNLLKNAYDATRALPGPRQRIEIRLSTGAEATLGIAVRDQGPGLEPGIAERLFEPFLTTKAEGLGLGLSICRTIAEAHGGRLHGAPATEGPGMVFTLTLPLSA